MHVDTVLPVLSCPFSRRRIVDFENYPRMVSGVNSLATYATDTKDGVTITKSFCAPSHAAAASLLLSRALSS